MSHEANDIFNDSYHDAVNELAATIKEAMAVMDSQQATINRLRPVVEAATEWVEYKQFAACNPTTNKTLKMRRAHWNRLVNEVGRYEEWQLDL